MVAPGNNGDEGEDEDQAKERRETVKNTLNLIYEEAASVSDHDQVEAQPPRSLEPSGDGATASERELKVSEPPPTELPAAEMEAQHEGSQDVEEVEGQQTEEQAPDQLGDQMQHEGDDF